MYLPLHFWLMYLLLACSLLLFTLGQKFIDVDNELYFKEPVIPLRGFNFTISGKTLLKGPNERVLNLGTLAASAALCQVSLINKGLTDIKLDGTLQFNLYEYIEMNQTAQFEQMLLYSSSLYNKSTNAPLNPAFPPTDTYFGLVNQGDGKIDSAITGASRVPFMGTGSFAQDDPLGNDLYFNQLINQTFFAVQASSNISVFQATVSFLEFMNWTLVGAIYESTVFGYSNQQRTKIYQEQFEKPYFACGSIFQGITTDIRSNQTDLKRGREYCDCIDSFEKISVIVLFATLNNAFFITEYLREACNDPDYTYIVTSENVFTPDTLRESTTSPLANGFLIRAFYEWDYASYFKTCVDYLDNPKDSPIYQSHTEFFQFWANCSVGTSNIEDFPVCDKSRLNLAPCTCSDEIINSASSGLPQLFFAIDSVTVIAAGLSLLQNNCSYLNEMQSIYAPESNPIDFCSLTTITPSTMNYATRLVNITGYTGQIQFPSNSRIRLNRDYFSYQISDSVANLNYIGNYSIYGQNFNAAAISFPDGNVPFSRIVVHEPTLSDAIVAFNFGLSIFFLAFFIAIFIFLLVKQDSKVLRRNSPLMTQIMCIGIFMHALSLTLCSFGVSDAICWIGEFVSSIAISLYIGALLAKNYRIYRIFSNEGAMALEIKTSRLVWFIIALTAYFLLIQLFILLDGYGAIEKVAKGNAFYVYLSCASKTEALDELYLFFSNVSRVILLLAASILSFLIRKVHAFYNESMPLAIISYTYLMSMILLSPLFYLLAGSTDSEILRYVVRAVQIVIVCVTALCFYFLPLVWRVIKFERDDFA